MRLPAVPLLFLLAAALALPPGEAGHGGNVRVEGDSGFGAPHWTGAGTPADPFRPTFGAIAASGGYGVELVGTTLHVNLSGITITGGGAASDGIRLQNVRNVTVWGSTLETNRVGILVKDSAEVTLAGNTIKTSQIGILLESSRQTHVRDNRISLNDKDVELRSASTGNTFLRNNLSTATGQTGFFFADNRSYENTIDPTNLVNAVPVRWYTGLAGTPSSPIVVSDVSVTLAGITNVAQVMVHNSSHVRLERITATSGTGAGIHLLGSRNVDLVRPTADGNAGAGIFTELSNTTSVSNASLRGNGGPGVRAQSADGAVVDSATATGNAGAGLSFSSSPNVVVRSSNASGNSAAGILLEAAASATLDASSAWSNGQAGVRVTGTTNVALLRALSIGANGGGGIVADAARNLTIETSTLTSNAGIEISFDGAHDALVRSSTIQGAGSTGVSLARTFARIENNTIRDHGVAVAFVQSVRSNLSSNTIVLGPAGIGLAFDGPGSYDNDIAPTNTVNGTAVRWYTNLAGPATLPSLGVETRGITNVAQIMIYRSANVTLSGPTARNGVAAGIVAWESPDLNVSGGSIGGNGAHGVLAQTSPRLRLSGASIGPSAADGVKLAGSAGAILENNVIQSSGLSGILVETSDTPTLRGNAVSASGGQGILLDRVGPGFAVVDNNVVQQSTLGGIVASSSTVGSVRANTLSNNGPEGIHLAKVPVGARLDANHITNHTRAVRLAESSGTEILASTIVKVTGQVGFHFDDVESYNVTLPPSNTVNGIPARWYVGAANLTIPDVRAELAGLTNIAQVMVYRSSFVNLSGPVAANGTTGLYVLSSHNVTILDARAENNTAHGVLAGSTQDVTVRGGVSSRNGDHGLAATASSRLRVDALAARDNQKAGLSVEGGLSPTISNVTAERNAASGIATLHAAGLRVENSTLRENAGGLSASGGTIERLHANNLSHNGVHGLQLHTVSGLGNVTGNRLLNHTSGIEILATSAKRFEDNLVTILPNQTGWRFHEPASYANTIDATNLVNGVAMRWYADVANVTVSNVSVDLRGITNVAQVMLYRTQNVTLDGVRTTNGSGFGIHVVEGTNASVLRSHSANNSAHGIEVLAAGTVAIRNTTARDNGGYGARSASTTTITFDNATLAANALAGLLLQHGEQRVLQSTIVANGGEGIRSSLGLPVNVTRSTVAQNRAMGIVLDRAGGPHVYDNVVTGNADAGLRLVQVGGATRIGGNTITNHTRGIEIENTEFAEVHGNSVVILAHQTGFHFADEISYNNVVSTSNTVNGQPVHWYTTLAGSEGNRITLTGVRSELRGATNVAQVMLYRSAYVDMPGVVATNGTARGIYLYRSSSIGLEGANASGNALHGVHLHATLSSTVRGLVARGSGEGVRLTDSHSNVVSHVNATGAANGVVLADAGARDNRVEEIEVNGTARGVVDSAWNGASPVGNNLVVDAGAAKRARAGQNVSFGDAMATSRLDTTRITAQTWSFGDGSQPSTSTSASLHRPLHAYANPGTYRATLSATAADGTTLTDSVAVEIVPPLTAPRSLFATAGARNTTLQWATPISDGASPITAYRIYRGFTPSDAALIVSVPGSTLIHLDTGLQNGRTYYYEVSAVNADGEGPKISAVSTPASVPGAPEGLTATPSPGAVALAWTAPADPGGMPLQGYAILRSVNGSAFGTVATLGNTTSYTDPGLVNGVPYAYAVRAFNALGSGPLSSNASATPLGPPGPPRDARPLPGDASVVLVWAAPFDNGGSAVTGYRLWRGATNETLVQLPDVLPASATSHRDTGLSNGRTYSFAVSAVNAIGEGARSAPVRATPEAVDALRPAVFGQEPPDGEVLAGSPEAIRAQFVDNDGIDLASVIVYLDGSQVGANVSADGFVYTLPAPLDRGEHTVRIVVRDPTGNEADESWRFRIVAEEDLVARISFANQTLLPERALPGANVTARLVVRNGGYASGNATASVLFRDNALAYAEVEVPGRAHVEAFLEFNAPTVVGNYTLDVAGASLTLMVAEAEPAPGETPPDENPEPAPPTPSDGGPRRPPRGTPPPRPADEKGTPVPALLLPVAFLAAAALRGRKR